MNGLPVTVNVDQGYELKVKAKERKKQETNGQEPARGLKEREALPLEMREEEDEHYEQGGIGCYNGLHLVEPGL